MGNMRPVLDFKLLLQVFALILVQTKCQDGLSGQDLLRLHHLAMSSPHGESIFRTNSDSPNEQLSTGGEYQFGITQPDERKYDFTIRTGRSDSRRKIFHIKNPFSSQQKNEEREQRDSVEPEAGASNQYASMQFSLPPEGFLNQLRNEKAMEQLSTPLTDMSYVSTAQSQYQFPSNGFEEPNKQYSHQFDTNSGSSPIRSFDGSFSTQTGPPSFANENYQPTMSPLSYNIVSTASSNPQYMTATPAPIFGSSPAPYVSSPLSQMFSSQSSALRDFDNKYKTSVYSPSFDSGREYQNMQIDHYNHGNNGIRYPYGNQNDFPTTTAASVTSTALSELSDSWKSILLNNYNNLIKSSQEQNRDKNEKVTNSGSNSKVSNNEPSANNMYLNYASPGYDYLSNLRTHTRDLNDDLGQPEIYSHGTYGWKLNGKRPLIGPELFDSGYSQSKPFSMPLQSSNYPDNSLFKTTSSSNYMNLGQDPQKSSSSNSGGPASLGMNKYSSFLSDDFMKSAAKIQEQNKFQQSINNKPLPYYGHENSGYAPNYQGSHSNNVITTYFGNLEKNKEVKHSSESSTMNPYAYAYGQSDVVTAMPNIFTYFKESVTDGKFKQPFDHAKALKNIVPIDVSNVVYSENNQKSQPSMSSYMKYTPSKDPTMDQNIKQFMEQYKPISDSFYKDKNGGYGINIKKPEYFGTPMESVKPTNYINMESNKMSYPESFINHGFEYDSKYFTENKFPNYLPQASTSFEQHVMSPLGTNIMNNRQQQDSNGMLKLSDLPYKLSPSVLSSISDSSRLHSLPNMDQKAFAQAIGGRINQNVASHQLDTDKDIFNKLYSTNKPQGSNYPQPDDVEANTGYSTFNGFKIANPFNVDMRLVHNFLKRKPESSQLSSLKDFYNKPPTYQPEPQSSHQMLAKSEGSEIDDGFFLESSSRSADSKPFDVLASLRAKIREADPESLQAVSDMINSPKHSLNSNFKYSRSQEEDIGILPAAEASNNYPIGAVVDGEDGVIPDDDTHSPVKSNKNKENEEDTKASSISLVEEKDKKPMRHPNSLLTGRINYPRKYLHDGIKEPYPLLKPPPRPVSRLRGLLRGEKRGRRRVNRVKIARIMHVAPLFADEVADRPISNEDSEKKSEKE